jgi:hypothetical protein
MRRCLKKLFFFLNVTQTAFPDQVLLHLAVVIPIDLHLNRHLVPGSIILLDHCSINPVLAGLDNQCRRFEAASHLALSVHNQLITNSGVLLKLV